MRRYPEMEHVPHDWQRMGGEGRVFPPDPLHSGPFVWSAMAILYGKNLEINDVQTRTLQTIAGLPEKSIRISAAVDPYSRGEHSLTTTQVGNQMAFSLHSPKDGHQKPFSTLLYSQGKQPYTLAIDFAEVDLHALRLSKSVHRDTYFFWTYSDVLQRELRNGVQTVFVQELKKHAAEYPALRRAVLEATSLSLSGLVLLYSQLAALNTGSGYNAELGGVGISATAGVYVFLNTIITLMPFAERMLNAKDPLTQQDVHYLMERLREYGLADLFTPGALTRSVAGPLRALEQFEETFIRPIHSLQ